MYWPGKDKPYNDVAETVRQIRDELEADKLPEHVHVVNEHSTVKFNGGNPVWLCGYAEGECRVIVCHAHKMIDGTWVKGKPYR